MIEASDSLPAPPSAFQAVLYPSRSLSTVGFAVLMAAIVTVSLVVGIGFAIAGAWPVTGFLGLDALLVYLAFRWNFREARRADFIKLDENGLTVRRVGPSGESNEWRFDAAWVQVAVEGSRLLLRSHGKELAIGAYLNAEERASFALALREAIRERRETWRS
jgi:uncharacterized membrane protein